MLKFIGSGSAFNTILGNNCAYLKIKKAIFIIDCGGTVFSELINKNILSEIEQINIFITHTHPDHVGSLGELIFYSHYVKNIRPNIYFPDVENLRILLMLMGVRSGKYLLFPDADWDDTSLKVSFFPTKHVDTIPCFGILISHKNQTIYYSGDSNEIPHKIFEMFLSGDIDILYQDTCGLDYDDNPHYFIGKLIEKIPENLRHKVCCMHIDNSLKLETVVENGFKIANK